MTLPLADTAPCPCGSGAHYAACCGRWHLAHTASAELRADSAEALMRSRYSAFVLQNAPYLLATWHASTRPPELSLEEPGLKWLGLQVKRHTRLDADHAEVAFVARSKLGGRAHRLQECSRFVREAGVWYYVDGRVDGEPV